MTALPEPPEGHYWRVQRGAQDHRDFYLHLMRRRPWWRGGDRSVDRFFINWQGRRLRSADIAEAARSVLALREEVAREESFVGDYPPKELP